jgi:hypothetical protein
MTTLNCPFCSAALPPKELEEGWCDTCGKKLPSAMVPRRRREVGGSAFVQQTVSGRLRIALGYLVGAVFSAVLGFGIVAAVFLGDYSERTYRNTRTGVIYTKSASTQQVEGVFGGLFALGWGVYFATRSVYRKTAAPQQSREPLRW